MNAFDANLTITAAAGRYALPVQPWAELVDPQIEAMLGYARREGRGTPDPRESLPLDRLPKTTPADHLQRLSTSAVHFMAYLSLESGPRELSRVAVGALADEVPGSQLLGPEDLQTQVAGGFAFEMRGRVGYIAFRHLEDQIADRARAVLTQWSASAELPEAIVLDLSRVDSGTPDTTATLVSIFAPAREAFSAVTREPDSGELKRTAWRGDPEGGAPQLAGARLFVVVSQETAGLSEATAAALRRYRGAELIGTATHGRGTILGWFALPWGGAYGIPMAELLDAKGEPMRGRKLLPDVCESGGGLVALTARDNEHYEEICSASQTRVGKDAAIRYVQRVIGQSQETMPQASRGLRPRAEDSIPGQLAQSAVMRIRAPTPSDKLRSPSGPKR